MHFDACKIFDLHKSSQRPLKGSLIIGFGLAISHVQSGALTKITIFLFIKK